MKTLKFVGLSLAFLAVLGVGCQGDAKPTEAEPKPEDKPITSTGSSAANTQSQQNEDARRKADQLNNSQP